MYTFEEHTGDIKIKIKAKGLCNILKELCKAISEITEGKGEKEEIIKEVIIEGNTLEDIIVGFGDELIFIMDTENITPIDVKECNIYKKDKLKVTLKVSFSNKKPNNILKAATYHDIKASENEAVIVFDI